MARKDNIERADRFGFREVTKKPLVMRAIQYDGTKEMAERLSQVFPGIMMSYTGGMFNGNLDIAMTEGVGSVRPQDLILVGQHGELSSIKPSHFHSQFVVGAKYYQECPDGEVSRSEHGAAT